MAVVRFTSLSGEEFTVPDRLSGEGPEIEIVICETGEFIDPESEALKFMPQPQPPEFERLSVVSPRPVANAVEFDDGIWSPTDDELDLAREEGDEIRRLLRGYYGS